MAIAGWTRGTRFIALVVLLIACDLNVACADTPPPMMTVAGKFDVTATGAATYQVPIIVPPGTAGMAPAIALNYSSQGGDGIVGMGWSLSGLPSITHCPRTYAQDNVRGDVAFNTYDRFCLEGHRLIKVGATVTCSDGTTTGVPYRNEIDDFTRIYACGTSGSAPTYFEMWTKAGQHMELGNTANSRVTVGTDGTYRTWAVDKIFDSVGNYMSITYNTGTGELYPKQIDYTVNAKQHLTAYNSIQFGYEYDNTTPRPDVVRTYHAGYYQKLTAVLNEIKTVASGNTVLDYKLAYREGTATTHFRLTSIKLYNGDGSKQLNTLSFGWQGTDDTALMTPFTISAHDSSLAFATDFNADGLTDGLQESPQNILYPGAYGQPVGSVTGTTIPIIGGGYLSLGQQSLILPKPTIGSTVDFDGDGYSDFYQAYNQPGTSNWWDYTYVNNQAGSVSKNQYGEYTDGSGQKIALGDFNGDGRTDYDDYKHPDQFQLSLGTSGGVTNFAPTAGVTLRQKLLADFNGDGCMDSYDNQHVTYSRFSATGTTLAACTDLAADSVSTPDWSSATTVAVGDFNGDGLSDFLVTKGDTAGSLNLSTGGSSIYKTGFSVPDDWAKYEIITGDWNGDGKTDIALMPTGCSSLPTDMHIWISTGEGSAGQIGFTEVTADQQTLLNSGDTVSCELGNTPTVSYAIGDWNSDGVIDLWVNKNSGNTGFTFNYTPELMTSISNGIGSTTNIQYAAINKNTTLYTKESGSTYPVQDFDGAYYVVQEMDASNGLGACVLPSTTNCYVTKYKYVGGKVDLSGRGFQGFHQRIVTDAQTGIVETAQYRLDFPYTGMVDTLTRVTTAASTGCNSGVTLLQTANDYGNTVNAHGASYFVYLKTATTIQNDCKWTAATPYRRTIVSYLNTDGTSSYDTVGGGPQLVTETVDQTMADGTDDNSTKVATNAYSDDQANWFVGRLTKTVVTTSATGAAPLTRTSTFAYDATTGLLNHEVVEPESVNQCGTGITSCCIGTGSLCLQTDYQYDGFGNRTSVQVKGLAAVVSGGTQQLELTTRSTQPQFDANGEFPTQTTDNMSHVEYYAFDANFGGPASQTDHNNLQTQWTYDGFGRLIQETRPDGTYTVTTYTYCTTAGGTATCPTLGPNSVAPAFVVKSVDHGVNSAQIGAARSTYYDGNSRVVATEVQGFPQSGTFPIIRQETDYDFAGRILQTSRPYFSTAAPIYTVNNSIDALGRPLKTTFPYASMTAAYTTFAYNGGQVTRVRHIVRPDGTTYGVTRITTNNARGLPVTIQEPSGNYVNTYTYDSLSDVLSVTDHSGNQLTYGYDLRGRKTSSHDPDLGSWTYAYDGFGSLFQQTDNKSQTSTLTYDGLGRLTLRTEPDLTSAWTYGQNSASHNVDKLILACTNSCAGMDYQRSTTYDANSKPLAVTLNISGTAYTYNHTYTVTTGRLKSLTYPSGLQVTYNYATTVGYLTSITDSTTGQAYWTAEARDAELHLTDQLAGNGVETYQIFDADTGMLSRTYAPSAGTIADMNYTFDSAGYLASRKDNVESLSEVFCYDTAGRMTYHSTSGPVDCSGSFTATETYAFSGNLKSKTDVGSYTYPASGNALAHAVSSITGTLNGVTNPKFDYDGNGNMTCEHTGASCGGPAVVRRTTYTSYNQPSQINYNSTNFINLSYDTEHNRIQQTSGLSGTTYLNDPVTGAIAESVNVGASTSRDYLFADGKMVAMRSTQGGTSTWNYYILDHLQSVAVITDQSGAVLSNGRLSYDAWGKMRNPDGSPDTTCNLPASSPSTRAFTSQEEMANLCLVNLNARVYDPSLGRMLSPDPVISDPSFTQSYNRYSYVNNNPVSAIDPSGLDPDETVIVLGELPYDLTYTPPDLNYMLFNFGFMPQQVSVFSSGTGQTASAKPSASGLAAGSFTGAWFRHDATDPFGRFSTLGGDLGAAKFSDGSSASGSFYTGLGSLTFEDLSRPATQPTLDAAGQGSSSVDANGASGIGVQHHYSFDVPLCLGCAPSDAFEAIRSASAPGAPYAQAGTNPVTLTGGNPILQTVDPNAMTILNTTLPGHRYYPGTVKLSIMQDQTGVVFERIEGNGTGAHAEENQILGPAIFSGLAIQAYGTLNPNTGVNTSPFGPH